MYAPNSDDAEYFVRKFGLLEPLDCPNKIVGGDFNTILDPEMDKMTEVSSGNYNVKSSKFINEYLTSEDWVDPWHIQNPDAKLYAWYRKLPSPTFSRLDFWLVPLELGQMVMKSFIIPGFMTDHSSISITINLCSNKRGEGYWKINNKILDDENFVKHTKQAIQDVIQYYDGTSKMMLWELIKLTIATEAKEFSKVRTNAMRIKFADLEKELQKLSTDISKSKAQKIETLGEIRKSMDEIMTERAQGAMVRSRARWYDGGEKTTKYFLNLEKRNFNKKTVTRLHTHEGTIVTHDNDILNEQRQFYQALYTESGAQWESYPSIPHPTITEENREMLDRLLALEELYQAMNTMASENIPGIDGLSVKVL